ncbi:hypothetical protein C370_07304 [Cryptococcus neoformans A1-35-8]|nr:hypothetical protein C353_07125 [Cryptococcus neoformans var. grubii AD1-83a]OXG41955.1 hypothetical protein C354_07108 [Cryptococcus neoformans var. grubii MW-RSA1955]OXH00381.1 hypothetical protein C369_07257 [Cryptococcus neoformans var. grubii A5-35-17]OXH00497.1 hypothetical protein C370_07304 [Cryptococcus neoformans var. grubii A1-35-8]
MSPLPTTLEQILPKELIHFWITEKQRLDKQKGKNSKYAKNKSQPKHAMPEAVKAFLKREILQKAWHKQLLEPSFKAACEDGVIMKCGDGVMRRIFPKIIIYSADLQEKSYMSGYTSCGTQCPNCMMKKENFANIGKIVDKVERKRFPRADSQEMQKAVLKARKRIFEHGRPIQSSKFIRSLLQPFGCSATLSPFSSVFGTFTPGDYHQIFATDLMHEMELGVIKNIVTYFYKIVFHSGTANVMDERFAKIPGFGSAIRKFRDSVTAAEGMTAREYEQVLLCLLPVISGLLPGFEPLASRLVYSLNVWFALAKLHLHTGETVKAMDDELSAFGKTLRAFKAKADIWQKRQVAKGSTSLEKLWSITTPKTHMMGHTSLSIKAFGPTVGYTTEMGELQHKHSKSAYANSNKGHDKDFQIAKRAFQRHKMDAIRRANKLRGHDLQRPTEKMHILNSDRKRRVRAPRGYHIRKLLQDMGDDSSCTSAT